jgi:hypothetical protein
VSNDVLAGNDAEVMTKRRGWGIYASHIGPGGSYMRRYIFRTPWFTLRLHHILRSDDDRHLHDHPFDFTSFLLTGGYHRAHGPVRLGVTRLRQGTEAVRPTGGTRRLSICASSVAAARNTTGVASASFGRRLKNCTA